LFQFRLATIGTINQYFPACTGRKLGRAFKIPAPLAKLYSIRDLHTTVVQPKPAM
jgi:hypothetical protein